MELEIEDGRAVRARPDGSVSPYGGYMCPKGLSSIEFHAGAEGRLLGSLKRRADGGHAAIDGEAALDEIGARLKALVAEHGPRAVAVYHGTGAYRSVLGGLLERAWVAALGTPNFFSTMTIDQSAKWVTMGRMGVFASGRHAIRDADLVLLAGGNPVVTHQGAPFAVAESGAPGKAFDALRARGADPRGDGGSNVGCLTSLVERLEPINFMPRFSGIGVRVRALASAKDALRHGDAGGQDGP